MEAVHNSEDLFSSQDDASLKEAQSALESPLPDNSDGNVQRNIQHESDTGKDAAHTMEQETPDLVFSEDMDFGVDSEKHKDSPDLANDLSDVDEPILALETEDNEEQLPPEQIETGDAGQDGEDSSKKPREERLAQFAFSRVKQIMKLDPDVGIVTSEALFLVTKAAELFLKTLAKDVSSHTLASKKKTMAMRDVNSTIDSVDSLMFLEGMMNVK